MSEAGDAINLKMDADVEGTCDSASTTVVELVPTESHRAESGQLEPVLCPDEFPMLDVAQNNAAETEVVVDTAQPDVDTKPTAVITEHPQPALSEHTTLIGVCEALEDRRKYLTEEAAAQTRYDVALEDSNLNPIVENKAAMGRGGDKSITRHVHTLNAAQNATYAASVNVQANMLRR